MCLPRAQFSHPPNHPHTSVIIFLVSSRGGWVCLQLRASNEGLLRPRVARAKETTHLPRYSHVLGD